MVMHRMPDEFIKVMLDNMKKIRAYGVLRIGIFGSCITGTAGDSSDVDVLVEFSRKTFDNYMGLKFFLEEKFERPVDMVILDTIKPALRESILSEVRYAA